MTKTITINPLTDEFKRVDAMSYHELLKDLNLENNPHLAQFYASYETNPQKATETLRKLAKATAQHIFDEVTAQLA
jgi:hypothetical protein